jgi:serine/threonine protein phosphatase PrpC
MVVASDGVWEFLSNIEVLKIIRPYREANDIEGACDKLMMESLRRWAIEEEGGVDDITFVLIFF